MLQLASFSSIPIQDELNKTSIKFVNPFGDKTSSFTCSEILIISERFSLLLVAEETISSDGAFLLDYNKDDPACGLYFIFHIYALPPSSNPDTLESRFGQTSIESIPLFSEEVAVRLVTELEKKEVGGFLFPVIMVSNGNGGRLKISAAANGLFRCARSEAPAGGQ